MGQISSVMGAIKGKVDNLRFSVSKGRNLVARQPQSYNDKNTQVQQDNRSLWRTITLLGSAFKIVCRAGFKQHTATMSAFNYFCKHTAMDNTGSADMSLGMVKMCKISDGSQLGVIPTLTTFEPTTGKVKITWTPNSNGTTALDDDKICIAVWDSTTKKGNSVITTIKRIVGTAEYAFPNLVGSVANNVAILYFFRAELTGECSPTQHN